MGVRDFFRRYSDLLFLLLMTAVAALLRGMLLDTSLTHDEVSAATRLYYTRFSDLIRDGVVPDGHPAGLQLFYWYWVRIFGLSDLSLRLPAYIVGLACIPAAYAAGRTWANRSCGLFMAACVAFSQYGMYYGILARPYIYGLLASLLLLSSWGRLVWHERQGWKNCLLTALMLDACAYLHYFSFMFACLVALSGFLLIPGRRMKRYLLVCMSAVLLYLPHVPVFLAQFGRKGVGGADGWLPAPQATFWVEYPAWLFHFSWLLLLVTAVMFFYYAWANRRVVIVPRNRLWTALALFSLPLLIGYFYSVWVNPVLQYSVLLFSYPMGLLLVFSVLDARWDGLKTAFILLLSVALLGSLAMRRGFFRMVRSSWYDIAVGEVLSTERLHPDSTVCVLDMTHQFQEYYQRKYGTGLPQLYCPYDRPDNREVRQLARNTSARYLVFCGGFDADRALLRESFPYLLSYQPLYPLELYVYCRDSVCCTECLEARQLRYRKTIGYGDLHVTEQDEFTDAFEMPFIRMDMDRHLRTDVTVTFSADDTLSDLLLVQETWKGDERIDWRSCSFKSFVMPGEMEQQAHLVLRYDMLFGSNRHLDNVRVKWYFWNPERGCSYRLREFRLSVWNANMQWLGLTQDMTR